MESDVTFFMRRALEERLAAANSKNDLAKQSHLQMAEGFEDLLTKLRPAGGKSFPAHGDASK